jgi:hypothetical protein
VMPSFSAVSSRERSARTALSSVATIRRLRCAPRAVSSLTATKREAAPLRTELDDTAVHRLDQCSRQSRDQHPSVRTTHSGCVTSPRW